MKRFEDMSTMTLVDHGAVRTAPAEATARMQAPEPALTPDYRHVSEPEVAAKELLDDRNGKSHKPANPGKRGTKRYLIGGAIALLACLGFTNYYVKFIAPFE